MGQKQTKSKSKSEISNIDRRKSTRKEVLETFHVFLVIPSKGLRKLHLKDVSTGGLGFQAEVGDRFESGAVFDCFFYINPSLKLPLQLKVAHVSDSVDGITRIGCELQDRTSKGYKAFASFIGMLDEFASFIES
jgi:hypothetical protein